MEIARNGVLLNQKNADWKQNENQELDLSLFKGSGDSRMLRRGGKAPLNLENRKFRVKRYEDKYSTNKAARPWRSFKKAPNKHLMKTKQQKSGVDIEPWGQGEQKVGDEMFDDLLFFD